MRSWPTRYLRGPSGYGGWDRLDLPSKRRREDRLHRSYLSDAVERLHGFKRLSLAPIAAEEVRADLVVLTHEHADHLDPDAVPVIARSNPAAALPGLGLPRGAGPGRRRRRADHRPGAEPGL